jgi:DNA-binding response OmpR family regulator
MSDSRPHVLVVEDAEEVREIIAIVLTRDGFAVSSFEDADPAFAAARRQRRALVITDLMLGGSSGLDLITRLRSDLAPPVPPIIACSGFTQFAQEALQRGAALFLPKPFELSTLRQAVQSLVANRPAVEHERAAADTRALRRRAIAAARDALARLAPLREDLHRRQRWTAEFLPRYYDFGQAFSLLLTDDRLELHASSDERVWRPGRTVDLALCRDILETNSALIVPDLASLGADVRAPDDTPLRFFAGVPMAVGSIAVGAICFVDRAPRRFDPGAFQVLAAMGRRASVVLSATSSEIGPLWTSTGLCSRDGLTLLLASELSRMEREPLLIGLFVFCGSTPSLPPQPARTVLASLEEDRFALLLARSEDAAGRTGLLAAVDEIVRSDGFTAGGLVSIEGGGEALFEARAVLSAAESLLETARRGRPGTIERMVVRREPQVSTAGDGGVGEQQHPPGGKER